MISPASTEKKHLCSNCLTAVQGAFCAHCGQKHHAVLRHFSQVINEFFNDILNFDNKLLGTLKPLLFQPGMLSEEYFANRRMRYVSPLKLYFFLSVITFFLVQQSVERNIDADNLIQVNTDETEKPDTEKLATSKPNTNKPTTKPAKDSALAEGLELNFNDKPWNAKTNPIHVDFLPNVVNSLLNDRIGRLDTVVRNKDWKKQFIHSLLSAMPQALLLMLPFFALLLKLVYWFQNRLYMEHLIVALHNHSFLLMYILCLVIANQFGIWWGESMAWLQTVINTLNTMLWIVLPIYFIVSLKRVYKQGWRKTIFKFFLIDFSYIFIFVFGLVTILVIGLMSI